MSTNGKTGGKKKGMTKGKAKGKENIKGSNEESGSLDVVNEGEILEENLRGLGDIEEYDSDNDEIIKDAFVIFKLLKKMKDYKGKV